MPTPIKAALSVVTLLVAAAGFWFQQSLGQDIAKWVVVFLGVFMVVSMWVFPEVARTKGAPASRK
ncbi:MAG: hypothetical protein AB7N54_00350 [Alphaproteobacteria bacterium]